MKKRILFYEVNPLYYKDANNDGIGDLKGMLKQADYFDHLGVEAIIMPNILSMYSTNNDDSNSYKTIIPEIGTMEDFHAFSNKLKLLDIKLIIDINIGSIKETHEWFKKAQQDKNTFKNMITTLKKDKYGDVITDDDSGVEGQTKHDDKTSTYYFVNEQTSEVSLNWKGGTIRNMFLDVARFWNVMGVTGFRFSNFEYLGQTKPLNKLEEHTTLLELRKFYRSLKEMNENFIIIGKSEIISGLESKILLSEKTRVLDYFQPLNYAKVGLDEKYGNDIVGKFSSTQLVKLIKTYSQKEQSILAFGTNTTGRPISRWGGDGQYNVELTKSLAILQLLYSSSPLIYYGEEIGAKNMGLTYLDDFQDPTLHERKRRYENQGVNVEAFMAAQVIQNPINSHTLMTWTDKKNGGFSRMEKTIVPVSHSYRDINVMAQYTSDSQPLNFYRKLISFIKEEEIKELIDDGTSSIKIIKLGRGPIQINHKYDDKEIIILSNLSMKSKNIKLPNNFKVILSSYYDKSYRKPISALQEFETIVLAKNINTIIVDNKPVLAPKKTQEKNSSKKNSHLIQEETPVKEEILVKKNNEEKKEHISKLIGKWSHPSKQSITTNPMNNKIKKPSEGSSKETKEDNLDMDENLISNDDTDRPIIKEKKDLTSTIEMVNISVKKPNTTMENVDMVNDYKNIPSKNNHKKDEKDDNMSGTIEMITNDIESTSEMNFDDSILDSEYEGDNDDKTR